MTGIVKPQHTGSPNLEFEVNLPLAWNRRALQMGGGGYDGSLVTGLTLFTLQPSNTDTPLKQGYVTLGSDGGHKGGPGFDGSFALDDEALVNYGKQSVKKAHDAAMAVIRKAYGRAPERFYFIGGSQGGHEALDAAARYPAGLRRRRRALSGLQRDDAASRIVERGQGALRGRRCGVDQPEEDEADWRRGLREVRRPRRREGRDHQQRRRMQCRLRREGTALPEWRRHRRHLPVRRAASSAVATITSEYKPGFAVAGMDTFPKWALLEGATLPGPSNFGQAPQPSNPLSGKEALLYSAGDQTVKNIITRDPKFETMKFDPKQFQAQTVKAGTIMDVTDVSLDKFRAKGGKIIMTHGTADDFITPHNSIAYYKRQVANFGQARLDSFMRFYVVPGLGHGFGVFNAKFDSLGALREWVENGKAPAGLVASDGNPNAKRTRPLCEYPEMAEVHRRAWQREPGGELHLRRALTRAVASLDPIERAILVLGPRALPPLARGWRIQPETGSVESLATRTVSVSQRGRCVQGLYWYRRWRVESIALCDLRDLCVNPFPCPHFLCGEVLRGCVVPAAGSESQRISRLPIHAFAETT